MITVELRDGRIVKAVKVNICIGRNNKRTYEVMNDKAIVTIFKPEEIGTIRGPIQEIYV